jgi:transcriptional regulator with XRE-family HTH domain
LRACREARELKQIELAKRVGVSLDRQQSYERGKVRMSAAIVIRMVRALGLRPADLFQGLAD